MEHRREDHFYRKLHRRDLHFDAEFALTYRCNLKCLHCYCSGNFSRKKELGTVQVKGIIDKLYRAGCLWLVLTGGEPLLRPDFLEIYSYAKKKGFLVTIFTNAALLDRHILKCFSRMPPHSIEVTLNAITESNYEKITRAGKGVLRQVRDNIKALAKAGLAVIVKTNLMELNKNEFPLIKSWALKTLGRRGNTYPFKFDFMLFPRLNGDKAPLRYRLDFKQLQDVLGRDKDIWRQYEKELHRSFPDPSFSRDLLYHCNGWREEVQVDPYGKIKFCHLSDKYSFDLRDRNLGEILKMIAEKVDKEKFKTSSKCRLCSLRPICSWCPARALLETGDREKPVPYYCRMAKSVADATRRLRNEK